MNLALSASLILGFGGMFWGAVVMLKERVGTPEDWSGGGYISLLTVVYMSFMLLFFAAHRTRVRKWLGEFDR